MKYSIYRLCRDNQRIENLKKEEKINSLPRTDYITGVDMYSFINSIILNCKKDYALLCHDDVVLPTNIDQQVKECITSTNNYLGEKNWAVIGNAGIEILTKKVLHYLTDPDIKIIPPFTKYPSLVETVDGNTMLLNIKSLRDKNVLLPKNLTGFHLYDIILCLEAQQKGLVCGVSSYLFVTHLSGGNRQAFINEWHKQKFQEYFSSNYTNKRISSLNGEIEIYEEKVRNGIDIEKAFRKNIITTFKNKKVTLNIISEKENLHIEKLKKKVNNSIKINILLGKDIKKLVKNLDSTEYSFTIILRNEDTLLEEVISYLQYMTAHSSIIVGDTKFGNSHVEESSNIIDIYTGKRKYPINFVIYNTVLLKKVIDKLTLTNNFLDDYLLLITASKYDNINTYPICFGSRKHIENNLAGYSFTTLLSDIVNNNLVTKNSYDFYRDSTEKLKEQIHAISKDYHEFLHFKNSVIWKILKKLRAIKTKIIKEK